MQKKNVVCRDNNHDVIVVGGGISGVAIAIWLVRNGFQSCLIERSDYSRIRSGESLDPGTKPFFRDLGYEPTEAVANRYYGITAVWGNEAAKENDFIFTPWQYGYTVIRNKFDESLLNHAAEHGVLCQRQARIIRYDREDANWKVCIQKKDGTENLSSRFLVLAQGRNGQIPFASTSRKYYDKLVGFSSLSEYDGDMPNRLMVRSTSTGWLYTNRLPGKHIVNCFFSDADLVKKRELNDWKYSWDARTSLLKSHAGEACAAVGDMVYSVDPLSGQGILKNLKMAFELSQCIKAYFAGRHGAIESYVSGNLRDFEQYRAQQTQAYAAETRWMDHPFWIRRTR